MAFDPTRVLFMGVSSTSICYYRCVLPATAMGADWVGVEGEPPKLRIDTGQVKRQTVKPVLLGGDYDVIVMQEVYGDGWLELMDNAQAKGIRVIYEINDYLHGIPKLVDHSYAEFYTPERLRGVEEAMEKADAVTVTTKYLKKKYQRFAKRIYVCQNGLDLKRYALTRPDRAGKVNVGWAGATGHYEALVPWLIKVADLMDLRENVNFVTVGQPVADDFKPRFGERALSVPWAGIEQYPGAMTLMDIALAPAAPTKFHRGKSDLRWLEAGALGIPMIGNAFLYPDVTHGVNGFIARSPEHAFEFMLALVESAELRQSMGEAARAYVREKRTIEAVLPQWKRALAGE